MWDQVTETRNGPFVSLVTGFLQSTFNDIITPRVVISIITIPSICDTFVIVVMTPFNVDLFE